MQELQLDGEMFHEYFRVTREQFRQLLTLVEPEIAKEETRLRETICPRQRLAITMRCDIIQCVIFSNTGLIQYKSAALTNIGIPVVD